MVEEPGTTTVEIPVQRRPRLTPAAAAVLIGALSLLSGLGLAAMSYRDPATEVIAEARVGPAGDDVQLPGGLIRIPAGALETEHTIRVHRSILDERLRLRGAGGEVEEFAAGTLPAYIFEPRDIRFAEPVTIVLEGSGTVLTVRDGVVLFVPGAVDRGAGTVTFSVLDFAFRTGSIPS